MLQRVFDPSVKSNCPSAPEDTSWIEVSTNLKSWSYPEPITKPYSVVDPPPAEFAILIPANSAPAPADPGDTLIPYEVIVPVVSVSAGVVRSTPLQLITPAAIS